MEIKFDKSADAVYIKLKRGRAHKTTTKGGAFLIDFDKKGNVLGFEILNYLKNLPEEAARPAVFIGQRRHPLPA